MVYYAARDGLIKIGTTDGLYGRVHQLQALTCPLLQMPVGGELPDAGEQPR